LADVFRKATMQIREALNAVTVAEFLRKWSGAAGR
jgi:hypothetical protein